MKCGTRRRHGGRLSVRVGAVLLLLAVTCIAHAEATEGESGLRLVSLNPSLTAIALSLGAGDALVGVDDFSARQQPAVAERPRVGGLWNPSLEAVVALAPRSPFFSKGVSETTSLRIEKRGRF